MSLKCTMILGDCLDVMPSLEARNFRFCLADFPYLCTQSHWDVPVDLKIFWQRWSHLCADKWTLVASATFRFAVALYLSAPKLFRYDLVFNKLLSSGFLQAKHAPMRYHENLLVFGKGRGIYNPQREQRKPGYRGPHKQCGGQHATWRLDNKPKVYHFTDTILPRSILPLMGEAKCKLTHSAQKPVVLINWLLKTYTNAGDAVLDPCSGSGTTAIGATSLGRNVVCIENDAACFDIALERVRKHVRDNNINAVIEERR